jgi:hypothetical protein
VLAVLATIFNSGRSRLRKKVMKEDILPGKF